MKIVERIADLQLPPDQQIGFVPTMGAFHEGHLQLMRQARESCETVVVSLFVNPLQFGVGEDFNRYPRDLAGDAEMAESVGVDVLFAPLVSEIYPDPVSTLISVPDVSKRWEGEHRPGHFDGVATVVAKLLNIVHPDIAFFGRKDFQQCAVISKMVRDLNMKAKISIEPTVREADGLAMSSRNRYLTPQEREKAPLIFQNLMSCAGQILKGEDVEKVLNEGVESLLKADFKVDYLAYVANGLLEPIKKLQEDSTLICAVRLGNTRLIDNFTVA